VDLFGLPVSMKIILGLALLLLILHSVWTLGYVYGIFLVALCFITGFVFEILGLSYGTVFGGHYLYHPGTRPTLLGVPLMVPLIWAGFIYAGYTIASSFSVWLNREKPSKHNHRIRDFLLLTALGGLVVVAIDLLMEPLQVKAGNWIWLDAGSYFNIPVGNLAGWFLVTFIATGIFRALEYHMPKRPQSINKSVFLIPVIGYGLLCLVFVAWALKLSLPVLSLIGFLAMFPITVVNVVLFLKWKRDARLSQEQS